MIAPILTDLLKAVGPFKDMQVRKGINPKILTALATQLVPGMELEELADLYNVASAVFTEVKTQSGTATVGQIVAHPSVTAFFQKHASTPVWKFLKCPRCPRVVERDTHHPSPCTCGYDWSAERADLLEFAQSCVRPPAVLEQFATELLRKEPPKV